MQQVQLSLFDALKCVPGKKGSRQNGYRMEEVVNISQVGGV